MKSSLDCLPPEIILHIHQNLRLYDLINLYQASEYQKQLCKRTLIERYNYSVQFRGNKVVSPIKSLNESIARLDAVDDKTNSNNSNNNNNNNNKNNNNNNNENITSSQIRSAATFVFIIELINSDKLLDKDLIGIARIIVSHFVARIVDHVWRGSSMKQSRNFFIICMLREWNQSEKFEEMFGVKFSTMVYPSKWYRLQQFLWVELDRTIQSGCRGMRDSEAKGLIELNKLGEMMSHIGTREEIFKLRRIPDKVAAKFLTLLCRAIIAACKTSVYRPDDPKEKSLASFYIERTRLAQEMEYLLRWLRGGFVIHNQNEGALTLDDLKECSKEIGTMKNCCLSCIHA